MLSAIWLRNVTWFWWWVRQIHRTSNRLRELAERMGKHAYLVDNADQLEQKWFTETAKNWCDSRHLAPEILIKQVIQRFAGLGLRRRRSWQAVKKNITFSLPKELRIPVTQA